MIKFAILVALVTISSHPGSGTAAALDYYEDIFEEPIVYLVPQVRQRRSPQLTGEGSEKAGTIRYDGQKTVWSN
ncbi:hypothetical protein L9G15_22750, partial [Shewanella sp. A3A]|nr:hypothetical protein [Shewanella ferrihydritica]